MGAASTYTMGTPTPPSNQPFTPKVHTPLRSAGYTAAVPADNADSAAPHTADPVPTAAAPSGFGTADPDPGPAGTAADTPAVGTAVPAAAAARTGRWPSCSPSSLCGECAVSGFVLTGCVGKVGAERGGLLDVLYGVDAGANESGFGEETHYCCWCEVWWCGFGGGRVVRFGTARRRSLGEGLELIERCGMFKRNKLYDALSALLVVSPSSVSPPTRSGLAKDSQSCVAMWLGIPIIHESVNQVKTSSNMPKATLLVTIETGYYIVDYLPSPVKVLDKIAESIHNPVRVLLTHGPI
ncbi:hypothetical protein V492_06823 [Pseudogymnoascus sp. VKM F-4246]|nr:hypothetical protein V492_06823 [Pseudogymnoascus sp. VKM F-4246]